MAYDDGGEGIILDPIYERTVLVDELRELFSKREADMAVDVNDSLDVTCVLAGMIEPFEADSRKYYEDATLAIIGFSKWFQVVYRTRGRIIGVVDYSRAITDDVIKGLGPNTAQNDSHLRHRLGRTLFNRDMSEQELHTYLGFRQQS